MCFALCYCTATESILQYAGRLLGHTTNSMGILSDTSEFAFFKKEEVY